MTGTDNTRYLEQSNTERRQATIGRARAAIAQLDHDGRAVTFCSVARTARVSRGWLYRESDIHALIISMRSAGLQTVPAVPAAQRRSTDSLREQLDAARAEITRLKSDSIAMHDQLARQLGTERASSHFRPARLAITNTSDDGGDMSTPQTPSSARPFHK